MGRAMVCQATDPPQVMVHRAIRYFVVLTMPIELFLLLLGLTLLQGFGVILNVPKRIWINQYLSWICCLVMRMMSIICNSGNYGKGNLYSVNLSAIVGQSVWLPCSRNLRN
ncbi:uncharacterized protein LOC142622770 isoform X5 [Castanea sativa]|uniref:uncharacterized protein LOC142622770 isoform X5 n=1 Tax=Castanea sativa TaxID=21020 RepID=UPI003F649997